MAPLGRPPVWRRRVIASVVASRTLWHLVALAAVSTYVFSVQRDALFWHLDGLEQLQRVEAQFRWVRFSASFGLDPYRGPGNLFSWSNFRLFPVYALQALVFGGTVGRVTTYVLYNCQNLLLLCLLARRLRLPVSVGIVAGWLLALLLTPLVWTNRTTPLFPMVPLAPQTFELMTFMVLFFVTFVEVGQRSPVWSLLSALGSICLMLWLSAAWPMEVVLTLPFLVTFSAVSIAVGSRRERGWKSGAVLASIGVLWICGALTYVYGFLTAGPVSFFSREIETYQSGLLWSSMVYQHDKFPAGLVLVTGSLVSAAAVLLGKEGGDSSRRRCAAAVHCLLVAGMFLAWPVAERVPFLHELRQMRLFYFELPTLPLYALFGAMAVVAMLDRVPVGRRLSPVRIEAAILVVIALVVLPGVRDLSASNPYRTPVRQTAITRLLQSATALTPGSAFRGRVASLYPPMPGRAAASWDAMIANDVALYGLVGNDLRFVGLWAYGIPTLQEYSQIIDPGTYFWITRAMSSGDDRQDMRNHALITRVDVPLLRLWGTRFVISPVPIAETPGLSLLLHESNQHLYELSDANIGQYSASSLETVRVRDVREMFETLHDTSDLLRRTYVFEDVPSGLVPGTVQIAVERSAIVVKARSSGTTLSVLPFTYSHCYRLSPGAAAQGARLVRVDLNFLGLLFTNDVDATLEMSVGLFNRPGCRLEDTRDYNRLGLAQLARGIPRGGLRSSVF